MIEFQYISSRFYLIYKTRSLSGITFLSPGSLANADSTLIETRDKKTIQGPDKRVVKCSRDRVCTSGLFQSLMALRHLSSQANS